MTYETENILIFTFSSSHALHSLKQELRTREKQYL